MKASGILAILVVLAFPAAAPGDALVAIEGGFAYRDVEFSVAPPHEILGTMVNRSGRTVQSACFLLELYRQQDLLRVVDFCVGDFINGQARVFRVETRVDPKQMTDFRIQFAGLP